MICKNLSLVLAIVRPFFTNKTLYIMFKNLLAIAIFTNAIGV
jgi:hypothetical protein